MLTLVSTTSRLLELEFLAFNYFIRDLSSLLGDLALARLDFRVIVLRCLRLVSIDL
jgi:hypothetical protein